jgi:hypothetical protein
VGVSAREPSRVPYDGWAPIPRRIFNDEANRLLTPTEGRVLKALYERQRPERWGVAYFHDLDALARRLAWEHSDDYLSKTLRSLRDKRRIDYETLPGRTHQPYEIRLIYLSEHSPSRKRRRQARLVRAQRVSVRAASRTQTLTWRGIPTRTTRSQSEQLETF